ncbi:hypothetical protein KP509_03G097500 [Ceratopteris richardii]|uniref:Uncharacterized protein n=1 Tax=Ceratopteris richardii TaxID=49495 RepID=A0A8T2V9I3_CERRI|nr:hypothetical protein KP509_03G097500 [Ceratopteris richardii]
MASSFDHCNNSNGDEEALHTVALEAHDPLSQLEGRRPSSIAASVDHCSNPNTTVELKTLDLLSQLEREYPSSIASSFDHFDNAIRTELCLTLFLPPAQVGGVASMDPEVEGHSSPSENAFSFIPQSKIERDYSLLSDFQSRPPSSYTRSIAELLSFKNEGNQDMKLARHDDAFVSRKLVGVSVTQTQRKRHACATPSPSMNKKRKLTKASVRDRHGPSSVAASFDHRSNADNTVESKTVEETKTVSSQARTARQACNRTCVLNY